MSENNPNSVETKEVHLVICREPGDYGYGHYDIVQLVTLDHDLALKYIESNKHDFLGELFIDTHQLN